MGGVAVKSPEDSYMPEIMKVPYSEDQRVRAERRWKRKEAALNEDLKPNNRSHSNARSTTVKTCWKKTSLTNNNGHMVEDEADEDYKKFLDTYGSYIYAESDYNDVFDNDADTVYNSDSDDDSDPQYKIFLENLRKDGNSYISRVFVKDQHVDICYEGEEEEEEELEERSDPMESRQSLDTEREPFDKTPAPDVSGVPDVSGPFNVCNVEFKMDDVDKDYQIFLNDLRIDDGDSIYVEAGSELQGRSSCVRNNSLFSNQEFDTPKVQCGNDEEQESHQSLESNIEMENDSADEDYLTFLNSHRVGHDGLDVVKVDSDLNFKSLNDRLNSQVAYQALDAPNSWCGIHKDNDINLGHMRDMNIQKTYKGNCCSSSSEPDLVVLERDQIGKNTPFIFSKTYDSSCFQNEKKPGDSSHFSSNYDCEFRRRLMNDLSRPYNKEECEKLLEEVQRKRQKERHAETRQGVLKSYRTHGFNKSYLELYPDLENTMAIFKEPHQILFLLRGFFFWLQNLTHDVLFRPWADKSCLEHLQNM